MSDCLGPEPDGAVEELVAGLANLAGLGVAKRPPGWEVRLLSCKVLVASV